MEQNKEKEMEDWCVDYYPERLGQSDRPTFSDLAFGNAYRYKAWHSACEKRVCDAVKKNYTIRTLLSALKQLDCAVDLPRHVACEKCSDGIVGGYDPKNNQVILCENNLRKRYDTEVILGHELIHMFDNCRAKVDFTNVKHLACTEIRAANLMHCQGRLSAWLQEDTKLFPDKDGEPLHVACVKKRAADSVAKVKQIPMDEAMKAVESVFSKCYNDLEPFGRRFLYNSPEAELIYRQRKNYGY